MFRALLLGVMHGLSDHQLQYMLLDRRSFKQFAGLVSEDIRRQLVMPSPGQWRFRDLPDQGRWARWSAYRHHPLTERIPFQNALEPIGALRGPSQPSYAAPRLQEPVVSGHLPRIPVAPNQATAAPLGQRGSVPLRTL